MKQDVTFGQFCDAFESAGRRDQFTYDGKKALYDWLEELSEDTGKEYDLDVIALCCELTEYADLDEFREDYSGDYEALEDVEDETQVIRIPGSEGFIIQQF